VILPIGLKKLDPEAAKRIHPNNVRYVVRAIEINLKAGRNKTDKKAKKPQSLNFVPRSFQMIKL